MFTTVFCCSDNQAEESIHEEIEAAKTCKRRLDHLTETENAVPAMANAWKKKRLDRMLVEYFLRTGYYNTAIQLARHSGIEVVATVLIFSYFIIQAQLYLFSLVLQLSLTANAVL